MHPAIQKGGVAVITGGGFGGIGYALASTFASHGMRICLIDNNASALREATDALRGGGGGGVNVPEGDVLGIEADVARYEDLQAAAKKVEQTFGKDSVRVLCLNAGMGASGATTWNGRMDIWTKTLGVNLFGVVNGSNAFTGSLVESDKEGLVIVTGSKQGITAPPATDPSYNTSKAAVKTFTERLAYELREETGKRVTAHLLVPGWTFTKLTKGSGTGEKPDGAWHPQQVVDYALPKIAKGDFYIICPDNDTPAELDLARMEWSSGDVAHNRPALSRWSKEYKDEFESFIKDKTGK